MSNDPIDFMAAKETAELRRDSVEINADQARWESLVDQLTLAMEASELSDSAVTSATLHALLHVVEADLADAKKRITNSLRGFHEV